MKLESFVKLTKVVWATISTPITPQNIKRCPFCGGPGQHVYMNLADDPHYRVVCTVCDAHGPRAPIMSDADRALWNIRYKDEKR